MSGPCVTRPDLCSISASAQQAGFSGTVRGLPSTDRCPSAEDDLPCRLGRACLTAIPAQSGIGRSAIAVSRAAHGLLPGWDCRAAYSHACQLANAASGSVPRASGYLNRQPAIAGARTVASHHGQRTEAGR